MKPRKPIFYDEQRRRWRRTSRVLEICGALFTGLIVIFFIQRCSLVPGFAGAAASNKSAARLHAGR